MSFDFIFMLTRDDRTVADAAAHLQTAIATGVHHIGFKDVGLPPGELTALNRDIQAAGATSYLEVVSLDRTREIAAARLALRMGVDCLLGGCNGVEVAPLLVGSNIGYFPFPGQVSGHPSVLTGTVQEITDDAVRLSNIPGVTGLDLTALMIGSEGTLGIVVGATLKLRPLPDGGVWTVGAFFDDETIAAAACTAVTAARIRPAIMELVGRDAVSMLAAYTGQPMAGAFVLVQTDELGAAATSEVVAEILAAHGGRVERTDDAARSDVLVQVRRQVHFALESFGTVLVEDVSVPRSRMADMFRACDEAAERHGVRLATTAHAGDGNLHPTFVFDGTEPSEAIWACANEVFEAAIAMGGTLTGEHGVGILKRRWLVDELGERQLALQRAVKAAFDPAGILNPGKAI